MRGRLVASGDHGYDRGEVSGIDAPHVEIGYSIVGFTLERITDLLLAKLRDLAIEEDGARLAQQPERPASEDQAPTPPMTGSSQFQPRAFPASRVTMARTEVSASCKDVEIGTTEVVVVVPAVPVLGVFGFVVMLGVFGFVVMLGVAIMAVHTVVTMAVFRFVITQEEGAAQIHDQTDHCDRDGLVEADGRRRGQSHGALSDEEQRDHRQSNSAAKSAESSDLAGAEGVAWVGSVSAGINVREYGESSCLVWHGRRRGLGRAALERQKPRVAMVDALHDAGWQRRFGLERPKLAGLAGETSGRPCAPVGAPLEDTHGEMFRCHQQTHQRSQFFVRLPPNLGGPTLPHAEPYIAAQDRRSWCECQSLFGQRFGEPGGENALPW